MNAQSVLQRIRNSFLLFLSFLFCLLACIWRIGKGTAAVHLFLVAVYDLSSRLRSCTFTADRDKPLYGRARSTDKSGARLLGVLRGVERVIGLFGMPTQNGDNAKAALA